MWYVFNKNATFVNLTKIIDWYCKTFTSIKNKNKIKEEAYKTSGQRKKKQQKLQGIKPNVVSLSTFFKQRKLFPKDIVNEALHAYIISEPVNEAVNTLG